MVQLKKLALFLAHVMLFDIKIPGNRSNSKECVGLIFDTLLVNNSGQ